VASNNVSLNVQDGVFLWGSPNTLVVGNTLLSNDGSGIYVRHSNGNITGNTAWNNEFAGIYLIGTRGGNITGNTLHNNSLYNIGILNSINITVSGNSVSSGSYGIYMDLSDGNIIMNNTATGNGRGIQLNESHDNSIAGNNVSDNTMQNMQSGIRLYKASGNAVSGNAVNNTGWGIMLWWSDGNNASGNTVQNSVTGISLGDFSWCDNNVSGNTIQNNEWGIWLYKASSDAVSGNAVNNSSRDGIWLSDSGGNAVLGNTIQNNGVGIRLQNSGGNAVSGNTIQNNSDGIRLERSDVNDISGNTIQNNEWGISLRRSGGNAVYHNIIINNERQAYDTNPAANDWHHPDLLEGNYWSDYPGVDDGSGTGKHAIAGDGIGDTHIPWPGPDYDYYPFILSLKVNSYLTDSDFTPITYFDPVFVKDKSGGHKLVATNPGQFYHNIEVTNDWPIAVDTLTIDANIPADFVLKGAVPIHIYLDGNDITDLCTIDGNTITVTNVPSGSMVYVTIHINYALKGTIYESLDTFEMKSYTFAVTVFGSGGTPSVPSEDLIGTYTSSATLIAHQKKTTAIAGFVTDGDGNPIAGALVELFDSKGNLIATTVTDEDGLYYFLDIPAGDYTVQVTYNGQVYTKTATAVSKELTQVDFKIE